MLILELYSDIVDYKNGNIRANYGWIDLICYSYNVHIGHGK